MLKRFSLLLLLAISLYSCTEILIYPSALNVYVQDGTVHTRYYKQKNIGKGDGSNDFQSIEMNTDINAADTPQEILGEQLYAVHGSVPADAKGDYMYFQRTAGTEPYYVLGSGSVVINTAGTTSITMSLADIQRAFEAGEFPYSCIEVIEEIAKQCPNAVIMIEDNEEHEIKESTIGWNSHAYLPSITLSIDEEL